jgi:hypothetical protein
LLSLLISIKVRKVENAYLFNEVECRKEHLRQCGIAFDEIHLYYGVKSERALYSIMRFGLNVNIRGVCNDEENRHIILSRSMVTTDAYAYNFLRNYKQVVQVYLIAITYESFLKNARGNDSNAALFEQKYVGMNANKDKFICKGGLTAYPRHVITYCKYS